MFLLCDTTTLLQITPSSVISSQFPPTTATLV